MPTSLAVRDHLEGLREALLAFTRYADRAGLRAPVPTTPGWTVRQLVAHQGMVHRWAAANLRGEKVDPEAIEREGRSEVDPLEWLRDGAIEFATALTQAPDDVSALVFLHDAPGPKPFWARRQCHETTIHAVDAQAAALGRAPAAEETWIGADLALDGIDELLRGFVTRSKSKLRSADPVSLAVRPVEGDRAWLVRISEEPAVTDVLAGGDPALDGADVTLAGGAVELYLALWNRGAAPGGAAGDGFELWREHARIEW